MGVMDGQIVEIRVIPGLDQIPAREWDACAAPEEADGGRPLYPFLTHRFLSALEESGSATPREGWGPQHLVASVDGEIAAVMPLYVKSHSQGEYVFDHSWAHAYERAGGDYYPKLQSAVPFTPATGPRLLVRPDGPVDRDTGRAALLQGAMQLAERNGISSLHLTFCTRDEWDFGGELGLLQRTDQQFHWLNHGYDTWDDFLGALASRKRKNLRKERERAVENGIEIHWLTGDAIEPEHWDAFWIFYQDTGSRKWGRPYLTREFFELAQERLRDDILLVMCRRAGRWIAGALNLIGRETLYGRYWGCHRRSPVPALRDLLLPGHRLRDRPRPEAGRGGSPGRPQAGPRLRACVDPQPALDHRSRLPRRRRPLSRRRARGGRVRELRRWRGERHSERTDNPVCAARQRSKGAETIVPRRDIQQHEVGVERVRPAADLGGRRTVVVGARGKDIDTSDDGLEPVARHPVLVGIEEDWIAVAAVRKGQVRPEAESDTVPVAVLPLSRSPAHFQFGASRRAIDIEVLAGFLSQSVRSRPSPRSRSERSYRPLPARRSRRLARPWAAAQTRRLS